MRVLLIVALLGAAPGLAMAQTTTPGGQLTPGPTASPQTSNTGTAGVLTTAPQSAPPASPVAPATTPSGAPPDVIVSPK